MQDFRRNAHSHQLEEIWRGIREMYLPKGDAGFRAKYTSDTNTGLATPDVLHSGADDDMLSFDEPLAAIKVHTALSLLTQRTPDVKWDSDNEEYEQTVPVLNALRKETWQDEQVREQYVMLWFYNVLYGTTHWRRFYEVMENDVYLPSKVNLATNDVEFEQTVRVEFDGVTAEAMSPFSVWMDPAAEPLKPRSARKVLYEKVFTMESLIKRFSLVHDEKWFLENVTPGPVEGYSGTNLVQVQFYENKDADLLYISTSETSGNVEIWKTHLPQNHKELSVMSGIWMPRDEKTPYGLGPIELMAEDKRASDDFKSMTLTQAKFSVYRAVFYTGSLTSEGEGGDIKIRPDRAYKVSEKPFFLEIPGPGNDAWQAMATLRDRVDEASGINKPLGGEIVKTTAFQTDLAKDAALSRLATPISLMANLLSWDAKLTFELQRQYYSLPKIEEIVDPAEITKLQEEVDKLRAENKEIPFDLWVDMETGEVDEEGNPVPKVFKGTYRTAQLNVEKTTNGQYIPSQSKKTAFLTPQCFDWKGKMYVVTNSILSIAPTIEKSNTMQMYNILIPLFSQPAELVAKPAMAIVKLHDQDPEDVLPETFLAYLKSVENPEQTPVAPPGMPGMPPGAPGAPEGAPPGPEGMPAVDPNGAMKFEQPGAPVVSTKMKGEKDMIMQRSEAISP